MQMMNLRHLLDMMLCVECSNQYRDRIERQDAHCFEAILRKLALVLAGRFAIVARRLR